MEHQKRIFVAFCCVFLTIVLVGCNYNNNQTEKQSKDVEGDLIQGNYQNSVNLIKPEPLPPVENDIVVERMPPPKKEDFFTIVTEIEEYELEKVLSHVIEYHNNKETAPIPFPNNLRLDEFISEEVEIEGDVTTLQVTAEAKKKNNKYIIKLTQDWNMTVEGVKVVSYWQYEISDTGIKLLNKKEDARWAEEKLMFE